MLHARSYFTPPPNLLLHRRVIQETLMGLKTRKWIDHRTKTVSIHFSLYNPPTQLFSSVSLISEVLPSGRLTVSVLVESFTIFHSNSFLQPYRIPLEVSSFVLKQFWRLKFCGQWMACSNFNEGFLSGFKMAPSSLSCTRQRKWCKTLFPLIQTPIFISSFHYHYILRGLNFTMSKSFYI